MISLRAEFATSNPTTSNPRDSWPAWTDQSWTIKAEAPAPETWTIGASIVQLVTIGAIEDEDADAFYQLDPENQQDFLGYLAQIGSPAKTWADWLALCLAGSPVSFPFHPTAEEQAEAAALFAGGSRRGRMMSRPVPTYNTLTDADLYPHGVC